MDLTQLVITVVAVLGIVLMGAMAIVPTALELRDGSDHEPHAVRPLPVSGHRQDHDLAA